MRKRTNCTVSLSISAQCGIMLVLSVPPMGVCFGSEMPEFENSAGMAFKLIPAGHFMMGSPNPEIERNPDELHHSVHIMGGVGKVTPPPGALPPEAAPSRPERTTPQNNLGGDFILR